MEYKNDSARLSCGDGAVIISQHQQEGEIVVSVTSEGNEAMMDKVSKELKTWVEKGKCRDMLTVLNKFGTLISEIAITFANENDGNDSDEGYDEGNDEIDKMVGSLHTAWLDEHYLKKRLEEKDTQLRSKRNSDASVDILGRPKACSSSSTGSDKVQNMFSSGASSKILIGDLLSLIKEKDALGYLVSAIDDNIYNWSVKISRFRPDSALAMDMAFLDSKFDYSEVELQLSFAMDLYPFFPPLVTIIRPRFEGFMLGKLACLECLKIGMKEKNWNPMSGEFL